MRKGNWFEEAALLNYTGVKNLDPRDPSAGKYTFVRCIEHSDRMNPKDYESVMANCIKDPAKHPHAKTLKDKVGPRAALLESKLKSEVESTFKASQTLTAETLRRVDYVSDFGANYNKPDFRASLRENVDTTRVPTFSANYVTDSPITYYSECVNRGKDITFPCTFTVSSNPFRKSCAFSTRAETNPSSFRTESNERPRPFPTVGEFAGLKVFRQRIFRHISVKFGLPLGSGKVVQRIVDMIWGLVTSSVPEIQVEALVHSLSLDYGFELTAEERRGLLSTFNGDGTGNLSLPELTNFLRGSLNPRAGELVDKVLARVEVSSQGLISETDIRKIYKGREPINVNKSGVNITLDDMYEYFTDCFAELDNVERFEQLLALWL